MAMIELRVNYDIAFTLKYPCKLCEKNIMHLTCRLDNMSPLGICVRTHVGQYNSIDNMTLYSYIQLKISKKIYHIEPFTLKYFKCNMCVHVNDMIMPGIYTQS